MTARAVSGSGVLVSGGSIKPGWRRRSEAVGRRERPSRFEMALKDSSRARTFASLILKVEAWSVVSRIAMLT